MTALRDDFNRFALNLMKGGIVYANFVTTVSPQHAWEAQYTDQGQGLGHTLHLHRNKFGGVLNGVDYDLWNPEIDQLIPAGTAANGSTASTTISRCCASVSFSPRASSRWSRRSGDWTARRASS